MADSLSTFNTRNPETPQTKKAAKGQKKNNAGGFSFKVSDFDRVKRFLILGSDQSFYQSGVELTEQNAKTLIRVAGKQHKELVDLVVEYSVEGRVPKQDTTLFALAILSSIGSDEERSYALSKLSTVARTGTALFQFVKYVGQFRGWGRGLRRAVSAWYTEKTPDKLAYQVAKYKNREGYSHRDVMRLAHPVAEDEDVQAVIKWAVKGEVTPSSNFPVVISQSLSAKDKTPGEIVNFLKNLGGDLALSWEMLPTEALADADVWKILLDADKVPLGALMRNLSRLSRLGVLKPLSKHAKLVTARLTDAERIKKSRLHPLTIIKAKYAYDRGYNDRGSENWTVNSTVSNALEKAFFLSFGNVEAADKRTLLAIDVSGSMTWSNIAGTQLTPRDAAAAMALVTVKSEPETMVTTFSGGWGSSSLTEVNINSSTSLDAAIRTINNQLAGGTDCSLPMLHAIAEDLEVDTFIVYTDSETYAGRMHPHEALEKYRKHSGIDARLIVVGMVSNGFTIANKNDSGMLDVVGFDTAAPQVMAQFSRGL